MVKRRKTAVERRRESENADHQAWQSFYPKLVATQTYIEAVRLLSESPIPDSPGRRYYSNLGFFLQSYAAPAGANGAELIEYRRLIRLFDAEGVLRKGALSQIEDALSDAIRRGIG